MSSEILSEFITFFFFLIVCVLGERKRGEGGSKVVTFLLYMGLRSLILISSFPCPNNI